MFSMAPTTKTPDDIHVLKSHYLRLSKYRNEGVHNLILKALGSIITFQETRIQLLYILRVIDHRGTTRGPVLHNKMLGILFDAITLFPTLQPLIDRLETLTNGCTPYTPDAQNLTDEDKERSKKNAQNVTDVIADITSITNCINCALADIMRTGGSMFSESETDKDGEDIFDKSSTACHNYISLTEHSSVCNFVKLKSALLCLLQNQFQPPHNYHVSSTFNLTAIHCNSPEYMDGGDTAATPDKHSPASRHSTLLKELFDHSITRLLSPHDANERDPPKHRALNSTKQNSLNQQLWRPPVITGYT
jgi:hypothetical protein